MNTQTMFSFIWQIAELLRGPYRPPQYERVILPLTVLRRFDSVLAATKYDVLTEYERIKDKHSGEMFDKLLNRKSGHVFHNHSPLDFQKLKGDPNNIQSHLQAYINGFSQNIRDIFDKFNFADEIQRMHEANILYLVIKNFAELDLHPSVVSNHEMGVLFEQLIRKFNEIANETAGDHFTPRDVIELMVQILLAPDDSTISNENVIRTMLDPTCGTGGMLSEAQHHFHELNNDAHLYVYGQDFNPSAYAIAASDLLLKGSTNSKIAYGDSLIDDQFEGKKFDYFLANPPFGVDWKRQQAEIKREHEKYGFRGRFGAGLPRVNDGALLFVQHMISKFQEYEPKNKEKQGSRLAVVLNGSPLFTGGAGSGESEIRKWIIENDWLETIIALPEQMFFNTGIATYIWVLTNRKIPQRQGKIQLIDAREQFEPMRRSLNNKRRELSADQIATLVRTYGEFTQSATSKILPNHHFGYNRVTIDRPLRLVYEMKPEGKSEFLDVFPHLLDDVQAIDREFGRTARDDWYAFDLAMRGFIQRRESRWKAPEYKRFRDVFTTIDQVAQPVIDTSHKRPDSSRTLEAIRVWGWFEDRRMPKQIVRYLADSQLRDFENVPHVTGEHHPLPDHEQLSFLAKPKETIPDLGAVSDYVRYHVLPHVDEAWADRQSLRSAYEINVNREFYTYTKPRPLAEIDADLRASVERIMILLNEVVG